MRRRSSVSSPAGPGRAPSGARALSCPTSPRRSSTILVREPMRASVSSALVAGVLVNVPPSSDALCELVLVGAAFAEPQAAGRVEIELSDGSGAGMTRPGARHELDLCRAALEL